MRFSQFPLVVLLLGCSSAPAAEPERVPPAAEGLLATEKVSGEGVWYDPRLEIFLRAVPRTAVTVWFDEQLLGDGKAYLRRAEEFADWRRSELREAATRTLQALSQKSFAAAEPKLKELQESRDITVLERHWVVNGFSAIATKAAVQALRDVPGVKKVFFVPPRGRLQLPRQVEVDTFPPVENPGKFDPNRYQHPWYARYLQADRVWKEFGITGGGTLNVVHDGNFVFSDNVVRNLYRNSQEVPGNGKDDDGNGLIDDYHGFNFDLNTPQLTMLPVEPTAVNPQAMHGHMCAAIICASGTEKSPFEFGIAPEASWAGVIAGRHLEAAVEWAIGQKADTYSMSFSLPNLFDYRSHWRKVMEQGSLCGIVFVSGSGNFAQTTQVPVQMRTPEDIPNVVFAAAGVQRDFSRTIFSSRGPVLWETEHYQDGRVPKPEVCAFNQGLPQLLLDGTVRGQAISGNSFAGPMFCGSISLLLAADPEVLPWDLREIVTSTATDVAAPGLDDETGHGLINCYLAMKEILRRKAIREGQDPTPFEKREPSDALDIAALQKQLADTRLIVGRIEPNTQAAALGLKQGDIIQSYAGIALQKREDVLAAKEKAEAAKLPEIPVVVVRGDKEFTLKFQPGAIGIVPAVLYTAPVFE